LVLLFAMDKASSSSEENFNARRWEFNLNSNSDAQVSHRQHQAIELPVGYNDRTLLTLKETEEKNSAKQKQQNTDLKIKKAWEVAQSPFKNIFMTLFMAWMAGSSVHIFSIMITLYSFINPMKAILGTNEAFARFEEPGTSLILQKLSYIAVNLITVGIAVYKCSVLGLLPTTVSDWVHYLPVKQPYEFSSGTLG